MKFLRVGEPGREVPALVDPDGILRDLTTLTTDLSGEALHPENLARLARADHTTLPVIPSGVRIGPPVAGTRNFVGIGLNFSDHAAEAGKPVPAEPIVFLKAVGSICGPNDDVVLPENSKKSDWEIELAVVIGRIARNVSRADALSYVAGYTICNDLSEREWQIERHGTWDKGKSFDTFGPIGPWLVTKDEVGDPHQLSMFLDVDGKRMQTGSTRSMVFGVEELVSYCSKCMTLFPGDIITTGTPPGVGLGMKPQVFLKPGNKMRLGVEKLGEQTQQVVAFR